MSVSPDGAESVPPTSSSSAEQESSGLAPGIKIALVLLLLGGAVTFLLFGSTATDAFVYSKLVDEVMNDQAGFTGKELRVEGELKNGSVQFREEPCEWRFVLQKNDKEMPVQFAQCVVPDTFRDGMGISVTVQGQLSAAGTFEANQVVAKCPSKYEMQEKAAAGEAMPHAPMPAGDVPSS